MAIIKYKRRDEIESELEELKLKLSEHNRLHGELNDILHSNGDKPSNPSLCDLVAYVKYDIKKLNEYKSRTCESCLFYTKTTQKNHICNLNHDIWHLDRGCEQWETK